MKEQKPKTISIRISPKMKARIEEEAVKNDVSNSHVVRHCVKETLNFSMGERIIDFKELKKDGERDL